LLLLGGSVECVWYLRCAVDVQNYWRAWRVVGATFMFLEYHKQR
jgi:hypothetical protein